MMNYVDLSEKAGSSQHTVEQKVPFNCPTTKAKTGMLCIVKSQTTNGVLKVKKFKTHSAQYIFCLVTLLFFQ